MPMRRLAASNPGLKGLLVHVRVVRALAAKGPFTHSDLALQIGAQLEHVRAVLNDLLDAKLAIPDRSPRADSAFWVLTPDGSRFAEHLVALDQFTSKLHEVREV